MKVELPHGYWNPKIELMPTNELRRLQLKRLKEVVRYAWENCRFYRVMIEIIFKDTDTWGNKPKCFTEWLRVAGELGEQQPTDLIY